jgi:hypothetical protein
MGMIVSNAETARWRRARKREEERWRRLNGPVTVRRATPAELERPQTDERGSRSRPVHERRFS